MSQNWCRSRERGGVRGRVGPGPGDERTPEPRRAECQDGGEHHDGHQHDRHRASLSSLVAVVVAFHLSTRIETREWSVGSGNNGPTSGRSVTDR